MRTIDAAKSSGLLEAIAPSDNITARPSWYNAMADRSPFEDEPQYETLFNHVARVLCRRRSQQHVLLVGDRGVGKSVLLADLARPSRAARYPGLAGAEFLLVDCRFFLPDESRKHITSIAAQAAANGNAVIGFRSVAALLRTDRPGVDNKRLLLSTLTRTRCRVIGLMSPREYDEWVADDPGMREIFARVDVDEPDVPTARKILRHLAKGMEVDFGVHVEADAIDEAVALTANYLLGERLPGKAVQVLYRICEDIEYDRTYLGSTKDRVTGDDVIKAVSAASGVPVETLRGVAEKADYESLLASQVVGQEHVVREVAAELGLIKAGLTDADKPASVMLFIGLTGTGKTEMAKALAQLYSNSKRLKTYTLGNFIEPHSVSGLIGVPPGYVGHDSGGPLVNDLNADPYGVFLLDEADKAHPDVLQPFLNLFDEGWIRDQRGTLARADKSIFILTTNVGQRMIADMVCEGKSMDDIASRMKEALAQIRHTKTDRPVFTPEFLARIKRVIVFRPLDRAAMGGICRKLIDQMREFWRERRNKAIEVSDDLIEHIADEAHARNEHSNGREGGRIVRKLLTDLVDVNVQRAISDRPDEYRAAASVKVELTPDHVSGPRSVNVRFEQRQEPNPAV